MYWAEFIPAEFHRSLQCRPYGQGLCIFAVDAPRQRHTALSLARSEAGCRFQVVCRRLLESYEGWTDCRNPASFAVALYCGIGSNSLNALVKAFDRLHIVLGWNSSCTG